MAAISVEDIRHTTFRALQAHGATEANAASLARAVAWAESFGNRICGLYYVESYCQQLLSGRVKGDARPVVDTVRPGAVVVDARYGFAQPAFEAGLDAACEAARMCGTASLAVGHAHTCTALGYFTEQIAKAGFIGLGFTNASPIVAPPGGQTRVIGTNPISFAVPDGTGGVAMIFDQSTTQVALGRITMAKAAGEPIPEGWAVDAEGKPTTDPDAALAGSLVSAGGYKGWGIGLMVEVMAAAMTGSVLSRDVKPLKAPEGEPHDLGQFYLLVDPALAPDFGKSLAGLKDAVSADPSSRLPGSQRAPADMVDVPDALWRTISDLAVRSVP